MTNIKPIIDRHRTIMEAAGHLRPVGKAQVSETVQAMRPSLAKVQAGLAERPDRFAVVQPSPLGILFEETLPKIEHVLVELGDERAEQIVARLCEHGQKMIADHGIDGAREHLKELFSDLPGMDRELKEENGAEEIIEVYRKLHYEGKEEDYLRLKLWEKIEILEVNEEGMIYLELRGETTDADLYWLRKCRKIQTLLGTALEQISNAGLAHLRGLKQLQTLALSINDIGDEGLECLSGLDQLRKLVLDHTHIRDTGLAHLSRLVQLRELHLGWTQISDGGLEHLKGLTQLRELYLSATRVSDEGIKAIKQAIPGLEVYE